MSGGAKDGAWQAMGRWRGRRRRREGVLNKYIFVVCLFSWMLFSLLSYNVHIAYKKGERCPAPAVWSRALRPVGWCYYAATLARYGCGGRKAKLTMKRGIQYMYAHQCSGHDRRAKQQVHRDLVCTAELSAITALVEWQEQRWGTETKNDP